MGKPYRKRYESKDSVLAHFIAQPSRYAQRIHEVATPLEPGMRLRARKLLARFYRPRRIMPSHARIAWERGRSLDLVGGRMRFGEKLRVIDQLADAVVENLRLGIVHNDLVVPNITVSRRKRPVIRIIDYETARPLTAENLGEVSPSGDYDAVRTIVVPYLAGEDERRQKRLQEYFEKRFLQKIAKKL